ncbi:MAG: thioredoxin domain-containing protein [Candidatus Andersenbacteria bacterium]
MPEEQKLVLSTPLAIIIAGAFIAFALYAGGKPSNQSTTTPPVVQNGGQQAAPGQPTPPPVGAFRPVDDSDHIRGAADGTITIVEYSDLECPFCKQFHATLQQVSEAYPDDVRWVYRHAPLAQLHKKAHAEANAAECAAEQGKFWEFVDLVFETTQGNDSLDLATMPNLARQVGVADIAQFESCVDGNKYAEKVEQQLADAQVAGLRGTPYSLVIGPDKGVTPIHGAQQYAQVKATIDSLL